MSHKAALPPRLPFGLSDDDHFSQAMAISRHPLPMEHETVLDEDLEFAAHMCTHFRSKLRELRQEAISVLRELQSRWQPVDRQLRSFQSEAVHRRVTARREFGLYCLAHRPSILGRHLVPFWPCARPAGSGLRSPLWCFPATTRVHDFAAGCLGRMVGAQPRHTANVACRQA